MRLTVVGCSGSFPGPESPASCYLLQAEGPDAAGVPRTWRILLDLGNGAFGALQRHVDPLEVDAIFLSHLHADHCLDLTSFYVVRRYHPGGHRGQVPVWGPVGTADRLARAYDLPLEPGMHQEFEFHTHDGAMELGPFAIEPVPVEHPVPAFGFRVTADGRTLGYSGDTGPCAGLDAIAQDVDLLLSEASFSARSANPAKLHLTGAECGEAATRGSSRRLVLTHVPPWGDPEVALADARTTYDGPIEVARAGLVYDV